MAAEGGRAGHLDEIGNAGAVILLDQPVELDERPAQMLRQHAPERRLAGAAQADQRDAPRAIGAARPRQARLDVLGERRQFALRHLRQQIEDGAERGGARAGFRQQRGTGQIERLRDGAQHARRTDCRRRFRSAPGIARRSARLAPIAAASCRAWRGCAGPRSRSRRGMRLRRRQGLVMRAFQPDLVVALSHGLSAQNAL